MWKRSFRVQGAHFNVWRTQRKVKIRSTTKTSPVSFLRSHLQMNWWKIMELSNLMKFTLVCQWPVALTVFKENHWKWIHKSYYLLMLFFRIFKRFCFYNLELTDRLTLVDMLLLCWNRLACLKLVYPKSFFVAALIAIYYRSTALLTLLCSVLCKSWNHHVHGSAELVLKGGWGVGGRCPLLA